MPRVKIDGALYLDKKIYDHVEEVAFLSKVTVREAIECLLHDHMVRSSASSRIFTVNTMNEKDNK